MGRPTYSFEFTQSGINMIVDACVPIAVGWKMFEVLQSAADADRASIAVKKPPMTLAKEPEFKVRSVTAPAAPQRSKASKLAPKAGKQRTTKTPA
jgi:hypothetical protein